MKGIDALVLRRADEQVQALDLRERTYTHDGQAVRARPAAKLPVPAKRTSCLFDGCTRPVRHSGTYCHAHWMRLRRGTTEAP